jgi:hypothetical protein
MLPELRRCGALALVLALPSCTVPDISFAGDDAAAPDATVDAVAGDSALLDARSETGPIDPGETTDAPEEPPPGAGADATADVAAEATADAATDAATDAGMDAATDPGADAASDAGADAATDAGASGCLGITLQPGMYCCADVLCVVPNSDTKKCQEACTTCEQACGDGGLTCCLSTSGSVIGCAPSPAGCN